MAAPTLTIDSITGTSATISITYTTTGDSATASLTTANWQYSLMVRHGLASEDVGKIKRKGLV